MCNYTQSIAVYGNRGYSMEMIANIVVYTLILLQPVLIQGLEVMECELLQKMKKMKGALGKELREISGEHFVESGGIRYYKKHGEIHGNTCEVMILVSVGSEFPDDIVVQSRTKNPTLAKKATQTYGSLPSIVPGLYEEAAADLMATASVRLKAPNSTVVQLRLDVPMMQRSKQYYLKKIGEFLEHCKQPIGMYAYYLKYWYVRLLPQILK